MALPAFIHRHNKLRIIRLFIYRYSRFRCSKDLSIFNWFEKTFFFRYIPFILIKFWKYCKENLHFSCSGFCSNHLKLSNISVWKISFPSASVFSHSTLRNAVKRIYHLSNFQKLKLNVSTRKEVWNLRGRLCLFFIIVS